MLTLNSRTFVSVQAATGAVFPLSCGAVVKDDWRIENPTYESIKLFPVSNLRPWEMPNTELLIQTALCIYINKNGIHFCLIKFISYYVCSWFTVVTWMPWLLSTDVLSLSFESPCREEWKIDMEHTHKIDAATSADDCNWGSKLETAEIVSPWIFWRFSLK